MKQVLAWVHLPPRTGTLGIQAFDEVGRFFRDTQIRNKVMNRPRRNCWGFEAIQLSFFCFFIIEACTIVANDSRDWLILKLKLATQLGGIDLCHLLSSPLLQKWKIAQVVPQLSTSSSFV